MRIKGYIYVMIAGLLWGILGPFSKLAFKEGLEPMEVAFWRAVIAWFFFGTHAFITKQLKIQKNDIFLVILFGITGIALLYGSYQLAIIKGGAALASVLLYTAPAWVAVMSAFFFKEKFTRVKLIALTMTLSGIACVSYGSANGNIDGVQISLGAIIFGLLAGFFYSLYSIFGKHFSSRYTSSNLFLYILPIGAFCIFPWVEFTHKTYTAWGALICIAVPSTYGAYFFYYLGLQTLEASKVAITATIEPIFAAIVAFFWWNEYFTIFGYAGSILVLAAVLLIILDEKISSATHQTE